MAESAKEKVNHSVKINAAKDKPNYITNEIYAPIKPRGAKHRGLRSEKVVVLYGYMW